MGDHLNQEFAAHPDAEAVLIELQGLGRIDYTGTLALKEAVVEATGANLTVSLAGISAHARRVLSRVWNGPLPEVDARQPEPNDTR